MERENQFTILDSTTGEVLFCKRDNVCAENQTAIPEMLTEPIPDGMMAYWDFETKTFYFK